MEQELMGYKEKVENMKLLLRHYQAQLESQKVRRDGVETVSRLLAESRQENVTLKKNQAAMETLIKNLQNRLAVNGISAKTDEDDDVIVPAMSKQTLNNLALENKRLRSMLQKDGTSSNNNSLHSENLDSIQRAKGDIETEQTLRQTLEKLEAENKSMKMKLYDLEALYKSSNNEKDRQLIAYQEEIKLLKQGQGLGVSGKQLTALPSLREQLRALMVQCQALDGQLETAVNVQPRQVELTRITSQSQEKDTVDGVNVKELMEEKEKLQEKVEEVTKMNQRWQEFYQERERYTGELEAQVKDLTERLRDALRGGASHEVQRQLEQHLAMSREKMESIEEIRRKAEDEAENLRRVLEAKDVEINQLRNEVSILSQQTGGTDASTIEHLKAQIQVCTEDFEKERQDRQAALQKVNSLQEQVSRMQKLNAHLQTLVANQAVAPRQGPQEHSHSHYGHHDHGGNLQPRGTFRYNPLEYDCPPSPQGGKSLRDPMQDFPDFEYEPPNFAGAAGGPVSMPGTATELIARNPRPKHSASATELGHHGDGKQENFLTCPKCNKEFSEERQGELLAHMDVCWE